VFGDACAADDAGPGSVSLLAGNYSVTATDVSVPVVAGDMTLRRTFTLFALAAGGPFGPGWVMALSVDAAGSSWSGLIAQWSFVKVIDAVGGVSFFARSADGGSADGVYVAKGGAAASGLSLTRSGSATGTTFTV
jgi:hypothetical protein